MTNAPPVPANVVIVTPTMDLVDTTKRYSIYKTEQANGINSYSDIKPPQGSYELLLFARNPINTVHAATVAQGRTKSGLFIDEYADLINLAALRYQIDPALIRAVIHAESAFNPLAISPRGAVGLTQLMPATARQLGVSNGFLAKESILGGTQYLAALLKQYDGDITLATAAYNAGAGAVKRYQGLPPYPETLAYVTRVKELHLRYQAALDDTVL